MVDRYLGCKLQRVYCFKHTLLERLVAEEFDFYPKNALSLLVQMTSFVPRKKLTEAGENFKNRHMVNGWKGIERPFFIVSCTDC